MSFKKTLWLGGPLLVRDVALGISGVAAALIAFIAGCAFASGGNFAWFAFWGLLGAASLCTSIQRLRRVDELFRPDVHPAVHDSRGRRSIDGIRGPCLAA